MDFILFLICFVEVNKLFAISDYLLKMRIWRPVQIQNPSPGRSFHKSQIDCVTSYCTFLKKLSYSVVAVINIVSTHQPLTF